MLIISSKSVFGAIIGSVIISVAVIGGLIYFGLPILFPSVEEENVVVQTKYGEWNTESYIYDNELTWSQMEDTELEIKVQKNSRIYATFSAIALLWLDSDFTGICKFLISLLVEGFANRTFLLDYYDGGPAYTYYREITYNLGINVVTQPLPSGTYTVSVQWRSAWDASGDNGISVAHAPKFNYSRTIFLEELK